MQSPSTPLDVITAAVLAAPALLGPQPRVKLVCIDGLAGAGKTTLARQLREALRARGISVSAMKTDDALRGWTGLPLLGGDLSQQLIRPLHRGHSGWYRAWDWANDQPGELVRVPSAEVVLLDGVGSAAPDYADLISLLVWLEAPRNLRLERVLQRDGSHTEAAINQWFDEEGVVQAQAGTRERADLSLDGSTGALME